LMCIIKSNIIGFVHNIRNMTMHASTMGETQILHVRLPKDLVKAIDLLGRTVCLSRADFIRYAIQEYLVAINPECAQDCQSIQEYVALRKMMSEMHINTSQATHDNL